MEDALYVKWPVHRSTFSRYIETPIEKLNLKYQNIYRLQPVLVSYIPDTDLRAAWAWLYNLTP